MKLCQRKTGQRTCELDVWQEYERRKSILKEKKLTPKQYSKGLQKIIRALGL